MWWFCRVPGHHKTLRTLVAFTVNLCLESRLQRGIIPLAPQRGRTDDGGVVLSELRVTSRLAVWRFGGGRIHHEVDRSGGAVNS